MRKPMARYWADIEAEEKRQKEKEERKEALYLLASLILFPIVGYMGIVIAFAADCGTF